MSNLLTYQTEHAAIDAHGRGCQIACYGPEDWRVWIGTGSAPWESDQPAPPVRRVTAAEFRDRFTLSEQAAITSLAYTGGGDVTAQVLLMRLATNRDGIDLDAAETVAGLDYLVSKDVIAAGRLAEILG